VRFNEDDEVDLRGGEYPDSTFNTFWESFISVFITLANDGWTTIYFNHYRAKGGVLSSLYFVSLILIGQLILLNLFLTIFLQNFDEDSISQQVIADQKKFQQKKKMELVKGILRKFFCCCFRAK